MKDLTCRVGYLLLTFVALESTAYAQTLDCATAIAEGRRLFQLGDFDEVLIVASDDPCKRAPRQEGADLLELEARSYLALNRLKDATSRVHRLLQKNPDFNPSATDDPLFVSLVSDERRSLVRSVSKLPENWRFAPATIMVVTADEIRQRGYRDLEAVLHDLPGFDFARGNGDVYSNIYLRGYRSNSTDRILLLVDGIEQNDLHSNIAYLSRQYPLSNIASIEVAYGPASTMYGANAFSGVINVITLEPDEVLSDGSHIGARTIVSGGSFSTGFVDATIWGRAAEGSDHAWSVTARSFRSEEQDLSSHLEWDYAASPAAGEADIATSYRKASLLEGKILDKYLCSSLGPGGQLGDLWSYPERCSVPNRDPVRRLDEARAQGLLEVRDFNGDGRPDLVLSDKGIGLARRLDEHLWQEVVRSRVPRFEDPTRDWFLGANVRFSNLRLTFQAWQQKEGTTPWYVDSYRLPGSAWAPRQVAFAMRYARPIGPVSLNLMTQYRRTQILDASTVSILATYGNGYLGVLDLLNGVLPEMRTYSVSQTSNQFRAEMSGVYQSENTNLVFGVDARDSSVQAGLKMDGAPLFSFRPDPQPSRVGTLDLGLFGQGDIKWFGAVKVVAGLRLDSNNVRNGERVPIRSFETKATESRLVSEFGKYFSPRFAIVGTFGNRTDHLKMIPGTLILKGIYSRASQLPSNFERFASEPVVREFASPTLGREEAENFEVGLAWEPNSRTRVEVSGYDTRFSDVLHTALKIDPCCTPARTGQFQSIGAFRVLGVQAVGSIRWRSGSAFASYSYTTGLNRGELKDQYGDDLAYRGEAILSLPIGDIARNRGAAGAQLALGRGLRLDVRVNASTGHPTGAATTSRLNLQRIPAFAVAHATLSYQLPKRDVLLQASGENILNARYWDPGVRSAEAFGYAGRLPQPGASLSLRLLWFVNNARTSTLQR